MTEQQIESLENSEIECNPLEKNGILINVEEDKKSMQFGLVVCGNSITCNLDVFEAVKLCSALQIAIDKMRSDNEEVKG